MSYRELRDLTEMLRALGYPHLVSMQSFRTPNFELVADILHWLVVRYDSSIAVDGNIETEVDRVHFLKATAQAMMLKGRIKLSLKNLYAANGFAVKELLKVAAVLHDAHRGAGSGGGLADEEVVPDAVGTAKFADLKSTRALAAAIVKHGAKLHELLALHPENREAYAGALSRNLEVAEVQRRLAGQAEAMSAQVNEMERMLANVSKDEAALRAKIDKRKSELERHEKRLSSLASVRPAFLDEYEKLEGTMVAHYEIYLQNWRNLQFLESELDKMHQGEQAGLEAHERQMRAMQRQLREEELRVLRGQADVDEQAIDNAMLNEGPTNFEDEEEDERVSQRAVKRPGGAGARRGKGRGGVGDGRMGGNFVGSMNPAEDEGEEGSGEEGSEEDDDDEDGSEKEGSDEEVVERGGGSGRRADEKGLIDDDDEEEDEEDGDDASDDAF